MMKDKVFFGRPLTKKEREVLHLILQGKTAHQVAEILNRDIGTINFHVANIRAKLGAHNQVQMVVNAIARHDLTFKEIRNAAGINLAA